MQLYPDYIFDLMVTRLLEGFNYERQAIENWDHGLTTPSEYHYQRDLWVACDAAIAESIKLAAYWSTLTESK
jgi:hypothetical protein